MHPAPRLIAVLLLLSAAAACNRNNIHQRADWKGYFSSHGVEGCFMLHDAAANEFQVYNLARTQQRFLPASTFQIMNALIGLEANIVADTAAVIPGDSVSRPGAAWKGDLSMARAFRVASLPYDQELARRIGRPLMLQWIDSVQYGNKTIGPHIDSFWLDNSLQISPDEELGLVEQLYNDKLPFMRRPQELVKAMMLMEKDSLHSLSYKTGWGQAEGRQIGWLVGWALMNGRPYFFVLNIEGPDSLDNFGALPMRIFRDLMQQEGFFTGQP